MKEEVWGATCISRIALIFHYHCSFCLQPWLKCWVPGLILRGSAWGSGGGGTRGGQGEGLSYFPLFSGPLTPCPLSLAKRHPALKGGSWRRAGGWVVGQRWLGVDDTGTFWPWEWSQVALVFWLLWVSVYIPFSGFKLKIPLHEHVYVSTCMMHEEHVRRGWKDPSLWPPWPWDSALISMGQVSRLSGKLAVEQRGALTPLRPPGKGSINLTLSGKNHNNSKPD